MRKKIDEQEPPERPRGNSNSTEEAIENFQLWSESGEFCPEGTIPIRRTTEKDIYRASSYRRYGRKPIKHVKRDSSGNGHEVRIQNPLAHVTWCESYHMAHKLPFILISNC